MVEKRGLMKMFVAAAAVDRLVVGRVIEERAATHEMFLPNGDRAGEVPLGVRRVASDRGLSAQSRRGGRGRMGQSVVLRRCKCSPGSVHNFKMVTVRQS